MSGVSGLSPGPQAGLQGSSPRHQHQSQAPQQHQQLEEPVQVSAMPLPPMHYVRLYGRGFDDGGDEDGAGRRGHGPPPAPPPAPPAPLSQRESYSMFGQTFAPEDCIVSSLESQGIRRLYSSKDVDRKRELRKLNVSILMNFLDLLDVLVKMPDSPKREEKLEDLNLLFIHMHHLTNEFRPHQARETLRVMLYVQQRRRIQAAEKFAAQLDKVKESIQEALECLGENADRDDNKLLVPLMSQEQTEGPESSPDIKDQDKRSILRDLKSVRGCTSEDDLMCKAVDACLAAFDSDRTCEEEAIHDYDDLGVKSEGLP